MAAVPEGAYLTSDQRAQLGRLVEEVNPKSTVAADIVRLTDLCENRTGWNVVRLKLAQFIESVCYDIALSACMAMNVVLVIKESDDGAKCKSEPDIGRTEEAWLAACNLILLSLFVIECSTKIYVYRAMFWINPWNMLDFSLIIGSVFNELLGSIYPSFSVIRLVRLFRLGRLLHLMVNFKPLYMIVTGFCSAIQSLFWACVLLLMATTAWSVVLVILVHPIAVDIATSDPGAYNGCERCSVAFSSVMSANLTLLQTVILGDAWGEICIPILDHSPWIGIIFCGIIATIDLCICNLILATIVHSAEEARNDDIKFIARTRRACEVQQRSRLIELCEELDTDDSGTLTFAELCEGYAVNTKFTAVFQSMGLSNEDVKSVLSIADEDGNGDVDYMEFIELILQLKSTDPKSMLMLMRQDVNDLKFKLGDAMETIMELLRPLRPHEEAGNNSRKSRRSISAIRMSMALHSGAQVRVAGEQRKAQQMHLKRSYSASESCKPRSSSISEEDKCEATSSETMQIGSEAKPRSSFISEEDKCEAISSETMQIGSEAKPRSSFISEEDKCEAISSETMQIGFEAMSSETIQVGSDVWEPLSPPKIPVVLATTLCRRADTRSHEDLLFISLPSSLIKLPMEPEPSLSALPSRNRFAQ